MDLFKNYFNYINAFDVFVASLSGLFLIVQLIANIPIRKKIRKKELEGFQSSEEVLEYKKKKNKNKLSWIQFINIIKEMISLLPFFGIFGTVLGLLNTLQAFTPGGGVELTSLIKEFAPALTSTITALIGTIVNMLVFNLLLLPPLIENENMRNKPIFSLRSTEDKKE